MDAGFGKIVGSRGEVSVDGAPDMMPGSWMLLGDAGPYETALPGGDTEREDVPCS